MSHTPKSQLSQLIILQEEIRKDFEWAEDKDIESVKKLLQYLDSSKVSEWSKEAINHTLIKLEQLINNYPIITIIGAAIEPENLLEWYDTDAVFVVADGSIGVFDELAETKQDWFWKRVLFIVSDADGYPHIELTFGKKIPFILHAHGDNMDNWKELIDNWKSAELTPPIVVTHQTFCEFDAAINPGGFTDGDRAVCFVLYLGANPEQIYTCGFNDLTIGRWSGLCDKNKKMKKLQWMAKIMDIVGLKWRG